MISYGMVGGGEGAFIGAVHRMAARLDGAFTLVAGVFSSDPARSMAFGQTLGLEPSRCYPDFDTMAQAEARRPDGIKAVSIVTPNHMHTAPTLAFLKAGIHVICDKPLAATEAQAQEMAQAVKASQSLFILTHNYTCYPMIRQARAMIARGDLGQLRVVQVEYLQDWLAGAPEAQGSKQAQWRVDPNKAGQGGALGDIGTHAWNLAAFVTGQEPTSLSADLTSFGVGRQLDDHAHILLRYQSGAKGSLIASQVAIGNENGLRLRIFGDKGGLDWHQEEPNRLWFTPIGGVKQLLTRNGAGALPENQATSRIPSGHPEGYLEGFATLYREAAEVILAHEAGTPQKHLLPGIDEGLSGMKFIAKALASHREGGEWTQF